MSGTNRINPEIPAEKFRSAYERLAELGSCDSLHSPEYRRVFDEWQAAGSPTNTDADGSSRARYN